MYEIFKITGWFDERKKSEIVHKKFFAKESALFVLHQSYVLLADNSSTSISILFWFTYLSW